MPLALTSRPRLSTVESIPRYSPVLSEWISWKSSRYKFAKPQRGEKRRFETKYRRQFSTWSLWEPYGPFKPPGPVLALGRYSIKLTRDFAWFRWYLLTHPLSISAGTGGTRLAMLLSQLCIICPSFHFQGRLQLCSFFHILLSHGFGMESEIILSIFSVWNSPVSNAGFRRTFSTQATDHQLLEFRNRISS